MKNNPVYYLIIIFIIIFPLISEGYESPSRILPNEYSEQDITNKQLIQEFKNFDWSNSENLKISVEKKGTYVLLDLLSGTEKWRDYNRAELSIDKYKTKDIDKDGVPDIIFTMNAQTSSDPIAVIIIKNINNHIYIFSIGSFHSNLNSLQDLNNNGVYEILSYTDSGWLDIYNWDGKKYTIANDIYPDFIRHHVEEICDNILKEEKYNLQEIIKRRYETINDAKKLIKEKLEKCKQLCVIAENEVLHKPLPYENIIDNEIRRLRNYPEETTEKISMKIIKPIGFIAAITHPIISKKDTDENISPISSSNQKLPANSSGINWKPTLIVIILIIILTTSFFIIRKRKQ